MASRLVEETDGVQKAETVIRTTTEDKNALVPQRKDIPNGVWEGIPEEGVSEWYEMGHDTHISSLHCVENGYMPTSQTAGVSQVGSAVG